MQRLGKITQEEWITEFNPNNVKLNDKLDPLVESFGEELNRVRNVLAPEKECKISLKHKQPWFNDEAKALKGRMCKMEKKCLKYKFESCWRPETHTMVYLISRRRQQSKTKLWIVTKIHANSTLW